MSNADPMIIIGAEIAGVHAAEGMRDAGYEGRIILIDRNTEMPYDRPPLSKEYMLDQMSEPEIDLWDAQKYKKLGIELMLGANVSALDPDNKTITTEGGMKLSYDKLLLATGSNPGKIKVPGGDLDGVFYLRNKSHAKAIKSYLENVNQAVIVGAGFIGTELASSLSQRGVKTTVVEKAAYPMEAVVGRDVSEFFLGMHRSHGVEMVMNDGIKAFKGKDAVESAVTENGLEIPCQAAMIAVGVKPDTSISHPDLKVEDGCYVVDEYGETSLADVYAAGDCALWPYQGSHIHVEHWEHAAGHGSNSAKNMAKPKSSPYDVTPYFWSDQYDRNFERLGHAADWAQSVIRGSFDKGEFTAFYLDNNDVIKAAFISNQPDNGDIIEPLIHEQTPVDPEVLGDENTSLKQATK